MNCWHWTRREWICHLMPPAVCLLVLAPLLFYVTDRKPPFEFASGVLTPRAAYAGQVVTVTWTTRNESGNDCDGVVYRILIDSQGVQWTLAPTEAVYARVRKGSAFSVNFNLPDGMAPGPAVYHSLPRYWCNWAQQLWPVQGQAPRLNFTVLPSPMR